MRLVALAALAALSAGSASAAEERVAFTDPRLKPYPGDDPCMCRAFGEAYAPGARICIGATLSECVVDINVMSWRRTPEPCPPA